MHLYELPPDCHAVIFSFLATRMTVATFVVSKSFDACLQGHFATVREILPLTWMPDYGKYSFQRYARLCVNAKHMQVSTLFSAKDVVKLMQSGAWKLSSLTIWLYDAKSINGAKLLRQLKETYTSLEELDITLHYPRGGEIAILSSWSRLTCLKLNMRFSSTGFTRRISSELSLFPTDGHLKHLKMTFDYKFVHYERFRQAMLHLPTSLERIFISMDERGYKSRFGKLFRQVRFKMTNNTNVSLTQLDELAAEMKSGHHPSLTFFCDSFLFRISYHCLYIKSMSANIPSKSDESEVDTLN